MKINLALWDRIVRFGFGCLLTIWASAGGPWWAYIGIYFIISAAWGFCFIYTFFKVRTATWKNSDWLVQDLQTDHTENNKDE